MTKTDFKSNLEILMITNTKSQNTLSLPLSSLRLISKNLKAKKITIEINLLALEKINRPETLDELVSSAKFDLATGDYQTFLSPQDLIADLHS